MLRHSLQGAYCEFKPMDDNSLESSNTEGNDNKVYVSTVIVERSDFRLHAALEQGAGSLPVSYPWIFIRGRLIGGASELRSLIKEAELQGKLEAASIPHGPGSYPEEPSWWEPPTPGMLGGYVLQTRVYGNVVRMYSLLHVLIFLFLSFVYYNKWLLLLFILDLSCTVLSGPVPLSPIGILATLAVWRRRGSHVTFLPFKAFIASSTLALLTLRLDPNPNPNRR